jgi:hypothetical protein
MVILVIIGWLVCGILTQGLLRHNYAQSIVGPVRGADRLILWFATLAGPLGLLTAITVCAIDWTWGLKFRKV